MDLLEEIDFQKNKDDTIRSLKKQKESLWDCLEYNVGIIEQI